MYKLSVLIVPLFLFTNQVQAACASVVSSTWDLSSSNPPKFQLPEHQISSPTIIYTTPQRATQTLFMCTDGNRNYYARLTNSLGGVVSGTGSSLYRLPGIKNLSISMDVKDPDINAKWVSLNSFAQRTITYGSHVGLYSRLKFYATGPFEPGTYSVTRTKVGEMWGELVSNSADKSPIVSLYLPAMTITVDNYGCSLNVPSSVVLSTDVEQLTRFNVTISQCGGVVVPLVRFSDPDAQASTKQALSNKGTAKGYELKLQTSSGNAITFIPVGTAARSEEITFGLMNVGQSRTVSFSALLSRTSEDISPGTLQFATILGVSYR
ncbi:hypothetical protein [Vibrio cholerae]|uniref:hypothetical protein n=1 Tax=Vibrio cholerae TaxID=666 RepID=UPI0011DA88B9|nr:hypothetical protein [Vibrio cholerae]TYA01629.1 hypothetical protein FXE48_09095 [Vibrio cholerae]